MNVVWDLMALTLWRPWPDAVLYGGKLIENRTWAPPARLIGNRLAIHAGLKYDKQAVYDMVRLGLYMPPSEKMSPKSAIVGVVTVVSAEVADIPDGQDVWYAGDVPWILGDVVALREPVPCKGRQGLWRVPADVAGAVLEQICPTT